MNAGETNGPLHASDTETGSADPDRLTAQAAERAQVVAQSDATTTGQDGGTNLGSRALTLEKPAGGETVTAAWIVGTALIIDFDLGAAKIAVAGGATTFTFSDGAVLKVVGLEIGASGLPESPVTLADGAVIKLTDLAGLAEITPAAGGTLSASPAAGGTPPGNQGHASIPTEPGDVGDGLVDTGALLYTDLSFSVPEQNGDTVENILEGAAGPITISIGDVTVLEGNPEFVEGGFGNDSDGEGGFELIDSSETTITFTVTLSAPSEQEVSVSYSVVPGTAQPGSADLHEGDYSALDPLSGTIVFAPGETTKTIVLNIVDDFEIEDTEGFSVVLSDPVGATLADDAATGTILDDDGEQSDEGGEDPLPLLDELIVDEGNGELDSTLSGSDAETGGSPLNQAVADGAFGLVATITAPEPDLPPPATE